MEGGGVRTVKLCDLVTSGLVPVKVMFPIKAGLLHYAAIERNSCTEGREKSSLLENLAEMKEKKISPHGIFAHFQYHPHILAGYPAMPHQIQLHVY